MDTIQITPIKILHDYFPSKVILGFDKYSKQLVVMKSISKEKIESILKEYKLLNSLNHPNILKVYNLINIPESNYVSMISEFIYYSDFTNFLSIFYDNIKLISKSPKFYEKFWRFFFIQIIEGLLYLKKNYISHGDIKPDNLLINKSFQVKLADLEYAEHFTNENFVSNLSCGTEDYKAPEIKKAHNPFQTDIFSIGVTFLNIMKMKNCRPLVDHFVKFGNQSIVWNHFKKQNQYSKNFFDMIENIILGSPEKRMTLENIINCDWFKEDYFTSEEIKKLLQKL